MAEQLEGPSTPQYRPALSPGAGAIDVGANTGKGELDGSRSRRWALWGAGTCLVLAIAALFATGQLYWRISVLGMKTRGEIPSMGWGELLWNLRPGSPVYLRQLPTVRSLDLAISNIYVKPSDSLAGADAFGHNCASCHGLDARGGDHGPPLAGGPLRHVSDWSIYRIVTQGIPSTVMRAHKLPERATWQIVNYLRSIQGQEVALASAPLVAVPYSKILTADADSSGWYTYSGDYKSHRYGTLNSINTRNVKGLHVAWQYQFGGTETALESSPLVANGTLFVTEAPATVVALDANDGSPRWRYVRPVPDGLLLCCARANRGVAILDSLVYVGTLDAHLVALNAANGRVVWDQEVAPWKDGYSITGAPLAVKNKIITGVGGGEYGIRGFISAFDATTGSQRWRFWTVPGPGERGSETWDGDSWKHGGAPTWLTGSYDPALNLLYWGVGNPGPDFNGDERAGDNLYSNSVVALDADAGTLKWHFQFTPHDDHDWDAVQIPVLLDANVGGVQRSLMAWANRNAFYYLLDRKTGEFLLARPYVRQTWASGIDSITGRPHVIESQHPTREGNVIWPSAAGATNWWSPSYSSEAGLLFVPALESSGRYYKAPPRFQAGEAFVGSVGQPATDAVAMICAIDPLTGVTKWQRRFGPSTTHRVGGVLSTAGGLVFIGNGTQMYALDARTGATLWEFNAGGQIVAAPITYVANGQQYIVITAGRMLIAFTI